MASDIYMLGDTVRCDVSHYQSYKKNELAVIRGISFGSNKNILIHLDNEKSEVGTTGYKSENFTVVKRAYKKEEKPMPAFERTNYFSVCLNDLSGGRFIAFDQEKMTVMRDTKSEAIRDVKENIQPGERYMLLQTVALIEVEDPKPPIKVTEYR